MKRTISYEWRGPEEPLDSRIVTACRMSIYEVEDNGDRLTARGSFTLHDHAEGCKGEDPWIAVGTCSNDTFEWVVQRAKPTPDEFVFTSRSGEPLFCLSDKTNAAIKAFIASKLTLITRSARENPNTNPFHIVHQPMRYVGPISKYRGACICHEIALSNNVQPFDWETLTDGGKYPSNCFECSCGTGWFRINPSNQWWVQVVDQNAWRMLTMFNGTAVEPIDFDPRSQTSLVMLVRTIRAFGLIPIG